VKGIQTPRVRPYVYPGTRVTLGLYGPMISSPQHPVLGANDVGASDVQHWTPHGIFQPFSRVWQFRVGGLVARSPGAVAQDAGLFQLIGIPDRFPVVQVKPAAGRTGSPPARSIAINPFPGVRPPTPSYPLPAAWPGSF